MKTHAIIPIFIPHFGCPNDCVFCNQKAITAKSAAPSIDEARGLIERNLSTIKANPHIKTTEIAFFGGSFTGIPMDEQSRYLALAKEYKDKKLVDYIHLSTRPDYIDTEILDNLRAHGVDVIELGVQSFDADVLKRSNRGHDAAVVYKSARMIKDYGFTLGIQLMIGLPGDSYAKCMYSVQETIKLAPAIARIYPTVVLEDTALFRMAALGTYQPLTQDEAVLTAKDMYRALTVAGINVIRVGLKSTDIINQDSDAIGAGSYHPAFRQLVEGEIAKEDIERQLTMHDAAGRTGVTDGDTDAVCAGRTTHSSHAHLAAGPGSSDALTTGAARADCPDARAAHQTTADCPDARVAHQATADCPRTGTSRKVTFLSHPASFSNMIGNSRANKLYFAQKYPDLSIRFRTDPSLPVGQYVVRWGLVR